MVQYVTWVVWVFPQSFAKSHFERMLFRSSNVRRLANGTVRKVTVSLVYINFASRKSAIKITGSSLGIHNCDNGLIGSIPWAIAVPSVTRSLLLLSWTSHAACVTHYSWRATSDTWWMAMLRRLAVANGPNINASRLSSCCATCTDWLLWYVL